MQQQFIQHQNCTVSFMSMSTGHPKCDKTRANWVTLLPQNISGDSINNTNYMLELEVFILEVMIDLYF